MMREQHPMFARQLRKRIDSIVLKPGEVLCCQDTAGH